MPTTIHEDLICRIADVTPGFKRKGFKQALRYYIESCHVLEADASDEDREDRQEGREALAEYNIYVPDGYCFEKSLNDFGWQVLNVFEVEVSHGLSQDKAWAYSYIDDYLRDYRVAMWLWVCDKHGCCTKWDPEEYYFSLRGWGVPGVPRERRDL